MKIGKYPWLNCLLPYYCIENGIVAGTELVTGYPRELTEKLVEGSISATPVPSFLYFVHKERIPISPGFSISSEGKVMSVILVSKKYRTLFEGARIGVSQYSTTSFNLLKVILGERGLNCRVEYMDEVKEGYNFTLLIGDDALKHTRYTVMDLGEEWYYLTGKPMVFAVFCGKPEAGKIMKRSVECGQKKFQEIVEMGVKAYGYPSEFIEEYLKCLKYRWSMKERKGLKEFEERCRDFRLIEDEREFI